MKKKSNIYSKFIEVFGFNRKNKTKYIFSADGKVFLTSYREALKLFMDKKVLFIGSGEATKLIVDNTDYLFFLRQNRAIKMSIVRKIERVLGKKYFWIVTSSKEESFIAASNGEYAIITKTKKINVLL